MADNKVPTQEDITKLTEALRKSREDVKAGSAALKKVQDEHVAAQATLTAELAAAKARVTEYESLGNPNAAQLHDHVAALVKVGVVQSTAELQAKLTELQTSLTASQTEAQTTKATLDSVRIAAAVKDAAVNNFVKKECITDLLTFGALELKCDAEGNVVTNDGVAVADWLDGQKATRGYMWPVARGSGGPNGHSARGDGDFNMGSSLNNPFAAGSWNMTKQGELARANPAMAERLAREAGVSLTLGKPK